MSKQVIEALIPPALALIEEHLVVQPEQEGELSYIPKVYKGYISSMGASLNQSGLLPTLAIFSARDSEDEGERWKLMIILTKLLKDKWTNRYEALATQTNRQGQPFPDEQRLLQFAAAKREDRTLLRAIRNDLVQASIAVKLALRTFNLK